MSSSYTPTPVKYRDLRQEARDTTATLTPEIQKLTSAQAHALTEWLIDANKYITEAMDAVDELERIENDIPQVEGEKLAPYLKQMKDHIHGFTARSFDILQYRHVFKPLAGVAEDAYYDAQKREDAEEDEPETTSCTAMSVGGVHSEGYFAGGRCEWCGEQYPAKIEIPAKGLNP